MWGCALPFLWCLGRWFLPSRSLFRILALTTAGPKVRSWSCSGSCSAPWLFSTLGAPADALEPCHIKLATLHFPLYMLLLPHGRTDPKADSPGLNPASQPCLTLREKRKNLGNPLSEKYVNFSWLSCCKILSECEKLAIDSCSLFISFAIILIFFGQIKASGRLCS